MHDGTLLFGEFGSGTVELRHRLVVVAALRIEANQNGGRKQRLQPQTFQRLGAALVVGADGDGRHVVAIGDAQQRERRRPIDRPGRRVAPRAVNGARQQDGHIAWALRTTVLPAEEKRKCGASSSGVRIHGHLDDRSLAADYLLYTLQVVSVVALHAHVDQTVPTVRGKATGTVGELGRRGWQHKGPRQVVKGSHVVLLAVGGVKVLKVPVLGARLHCREPCLDARQVARVARAAMDVTERLLIHRPDFR